MNRLLKYTAVVLLLGAALTFLGGCASPGAPLPTSTPEAATVTPARAVVLGDISDDPGEVIEGTQPMADYLADQLAPHGITHGEVRVASTAEEMTRLLVNGEVDLYFDSVYPATLISDASGAQPILRRWRFGVEEYFTVIFARADSGIETLDDLNGHLIALDNPYSTSGFFLPAVHLVENGLTLQGKASYNEPAGADEVGFVFSYDDENTLQWVLSDLVSAGATDDYNFYTAFPQDATENLVVLVETDPVPRQVVVARPGMDPALLEAVIQVLTTAHETEAGRASMEPFQTTRFDVFPETLEEAANRMRAMMETVQGIPLP